MSLHQRESNFFISYSILTCFHEINSPLNTCRPTERMLRLSLWKNKRRTAAAHPRSAFLSDYANSLAIDYIIIRSIFGTTKSVLSSSRCRCRCRVKSHRHEGKVYCTTHGRFIDVVVLMANTHQHIQTRMVFPLFATDDYSFSIFHFSDETNTWKLQQECDACFHPIIPHTAPILPFATTLSSSSSSHTCGVFTFAHEIKLMHTVTIPVAPRTTLKTSPFLIHREHCRNVTSSVSRFHFQPPHRRRTPNPWNTARTKVERFMLCIRSHNFFDFSQMTFSLTSLPALIKIRTENTLTKSAENVLVVFIHCQYTNTQTGPTFIFRKIAFW